MFATANMDRFVAWFRCKLLPKLRAGDVVVMDNLAAHHDRRVAYLPPYSPDLSPIESGWALQKQQFRCVAPRHPTHLRRVARRARFSVTKEHCRNWFAHRGYQGRLR